MDVVIIFLQNSEQVSNDLPKTGDKIPVESSIQLIFIDKTTENQAKEMLEKHSLSLKHFNDEYSYQITVKSNYPIKKIVDDLKKNKLIGRVVHATIDYEKNRPSNLTLFFNKSVNKKQAIGVVDSFPGLTIFKYGFNNYGFLMV